MFKPKLATLVPSLLCLAVGACAVSDDAVDPSTSDGDRLTLIQVEGSPLYFGEYVADGEMVRVLIRRMVTEVADDEVRYLAADLAATDFQVEVVLTDEASDVRLTVLGDRVSLDRRGLTGGALESVLARFGDAVLAFDIADPALPSAERQVIRDLANGTGSHGLDLLAPSAPENVPCHGEIQGFSLTNSGQVVTMRSEVACTVGGEYEFEVCTESFARSWIGGRTFGGCAGGAIVGGLAGSIVPFFGNVAGAVGGCIAGGIAGSFSQYGKTADKVCRKVPKETYEGTFITIGMPNNTMLCGDLGKNYEFKGYVQTSRKGGFFGLQTKWDDITALAATESFTCQ